LAVIKLLKIKKTNYFTLQLMRVFRVRKGAEILLCKGVEPIVFIYITRKIGNGYCSLLKCEKEK